MSTVYDSRETWDRLVLLLIAKPREGWEDTFAGITRREVERLAPQPSKEERPAPGQSERGLKGETEAKEDSADEAILH